MKKNLFNIVIATTLLSCISVGFADEGDNTTAAPTFYVGTNLGYSSMDIYGTWNDTSGLGYNLHGGFMFNHNFGFEAGYTQYANAKAPGGVKYKAYSVDMAAKGVYQFNNLVSAFGKLGVANLHGDGNTPGGSSGSKNELAPLFGAGIGYNVRYNVTINAGLSYVMDGNGQSDLGNMSLLYAGIDYRF